MKKVAPKSKKGGVRAGAGRPEGATKAKKSVSIDEEVMNKALAKWGGKLSPLLEKLLREYVD